GCPWAASWPAPRSARCSRPSSPPPATRAATRWPGLSRSRQAQRHGTRCAASSSSASRLPPTKCARWCWRSSHAGRRRPATGARADRHTRTLGGRSAMTTAAIDRTKRADFADLGRRFEFLLPLVGLIILQRIFWPAPLGIMLNGALVGGRIALIAVGIALVYRANRIVNFAQGDLGAVPATLGVMLVVAWGWSYWLGLAVGLAGALVLGGLVEMLIIRRFFNS